MLDDTHTCHPSRGETCEHRARLIKTHSRLLFLSLLVVECHRKGEECENDGADGEYDRSKVDGQTARYSSYTEYGVHADPRNVNWQVVEYNRSASICPPPTSSTRQIHHKCQRQECLCNIFPFRWLWLSPRGRRVLTEARPLLRQLFPSSGTHDTPPGGMSQISNKSRVGSGR